MMLLKEPDRHSGGESFTRWDDFLLPRQLRSTLNPLLNGSVRRTSFLEYICESPRVVSIGRRIYSKITSIHH